MSLRAYSNKIRETRRGSNAQPIETIKWSAMRSMVMLRDRQDLWPVLDVGCGESYHVEEQVRYGIPTVGVDIDIYGQLPLAQRRSFQQNGTYLPLVGADARHLPFKDNKFGRVNSYGMLMMLPFAVDELEGTPIWQDRNAVERTVVQVLSEMRRVVRPGGEVRIIGFSDREPRERRYFKPTPENLKQLGMAAGLTPLSVDYYKDSTFVEGLFLKG